MRLNSHCDSISSIVRTVAAITGIVAFASPAFGQTTGRGLPAPDLTKTKTLYEVGYSHLDTEWCWMYPQVINEFIPNTLNQNFALFDKYPDYVFNWTGANRYKFMKEYYPADFSKLKKYVAEGKWVTDGSSLEEGDVDVPSEESIIRHVLYGNEYFRKELNSSSTDFILPDCFGFPASLPSILAHCGLNGFSTQKLTWGSAVGIPFNLGVWVGPDGQSVFAALNGGDYTKQIKGDVSRDPYWINRLDKDGSISGFFADYNYYGVGDRGGSVRDSDAANLELSLVGTGRVHVISARSDQVFNDLGKYDTSSMPRYKGDLLLTWHSSGSATSQAEMKRWNHENEKLADATERASVAADWLGSLPYDKDRITDAWWKFLPGQFHDLLAGTALPMAYEYSWNDEVLALNEFAGQLQEAVGGVIRGLNTQGSGVPVIVYNPLSVAREDVVNATVTVPEAIPTGYIVTGANGKPVPSELLGVSGHTVKLLFLAAVPSVGYSVFHVVSASIGESQTPNALKVSPRSLENWHYRVILNSGGDVTSIYDKLAKKELLSSPLRLSFQYENPAQYPAWNMDYSDQMKPPIGYVDGPAKISVVENGPVQVAVKIDRWARGSHFIQTISLSSGEAGDRVEFANSIDWKSTESALKVILPLTVSNALATYNWELGTVQRSTDDPKKYEVPSHQWFDLTDTNGNYGVSVLIGDRYGSDKPTDSELRLTLLYTPGVRAGYVHQKTNDWGHHELTFAVEGHAGDWVNGRTQWTAMRFDRPLIAFQTISHTGSLGSKLSFARVSSPNVSIEALKQAEDSHKIVVRFNELAGKSETNVACRFAGPVLAADEVNGQEAKIGDARIDNGALVFDMTSYRPRAFEVTIGSPPVKLSSPASKPILLACNVNVTKPFGSATGGSFDKYGNAIPADMLSSTLVCDGVKFNLASSSAAKNAVECDGQTLSLPKNSSNKLYFLAASSDGDIPKAVFVVAGHPEKISIQAWDGHIGQWDDRVWGGQIPTLTYNMTNPLVGLRQGNIKRDTVAWYSDHYRHADGTNDAYAYCYLYRYSIALPVGAKAVRLPNDPRIKILAASVATDSNSEIAAVQPLYDTLIHATDDSPRVVTSPAANGRSAKVTIQSPLYFSSNSSLHYTLDGGVPTEASPKYVDPFTVTESAKVRAAYINLLGVVEGKATATAYVAQPSGPRVENITSPSSTTVALTFSEPVLKSTASIAANYTVSPANKVVSVVLAPDGQSTVLNLEKDLPSDRQSTVTITRVRSSLPSRLLLSGSTNLPIPQASVVFDDDAVQTFDNSTPPYSKNVPGLPTAATASWTINLYAYFDSTPGELTTLAGFGDDQDNTGTQRYILKYENGIHFWASNVDVTTGVPYDTGKWQMVTATFDGTTLRLYKNAKLINSAAITLNDVDPIVKIGPMGPWDNASKLDGKIAGVRIWNSALSADQIAALMSAMPSS